MQHVGLRDTVAPREDCQLWRVSWRALQVLHAQSRSPVRERWFLKLGCVAANDMFVEWSGGEQVLSSSCLHQLKFALYYH